MTTDTEGIDPDVIRAGLPGVRISPMRQLLRNIVDAAWNSATESNEVPSTPWADRIINNEIAALHSSDCPQRLMPDGSIQGPLDEACTPVHCPACDMNPTQLKYVQIGGKGPTYCLHGTSSISAYDALNKKYEQLQKEYDELKWRLESLSK